MRYAVRAEGSGGTQELFWRHSMIKRVGKREGNGPGPPQEDFCCVHGRVMSRERQGWGQQWRRSAQTRGHTGPGKRKKVERKGTVRS